MRRAAAFLVLVASLLIAAPLAHALPAVQNPSLQSVDWMNVQSSSGVPAVQFHLHWVNPPGNSNPTGAISGSVMSQMFGVFEPDIGPIGNFNVPAIQVGSFFDVFFEIPLDNLPPAPQQVLPGGGPTPNSPCSPQDHWDGNVDVNFSGPAGGGSSTWHNGKIMVCPGAGSSFIHVVTGCGLAAGTSWVMSALCPGFNATLVEEDRVTPAPNPLPPGWHGFISTSATAAVVPGTVCCFTIQFVCGSTPSLIYMCATACNWSTHGPTLGNVDWNPVHDAAGALNIRFHMRFENHDASNPTVPADGGVAAQNFGVFLPDQDQIGVFSVPPIPPSSFFDVFFDVPLNSLPPNPPPILPGGGPGPNAPCPPDTNWIGNVDVHFNNPAGTPNSQWHNGQLLICPGAGNSYIHMTTNCTLATGSTWSISGLCPGFSATLVENDHVTPAPNPLPPGWNGFICVSATAATPIGTTCCFNVLFDCGGSPARVRVCVTTCNWGPTSPKLASVDWANVAGSSGQDVRFHLRWQNNDPTHTTGQINGNLFSQMFGALLPDFGPVGGFSVPPLAPTSFFDVFLEVPLSSLPPNPAKVLPGGGPPSGHAIRGGASPAQAGPGPCPPDSAWQGNVDIQWTDPASGLGVGQVNYHFGQLLVDQGHGNSYIHLITNCNNATGSSWSFAGLCPGFSATLFNEDRVTPAPLILPPGWTGWIAVSAAGSVPPGTTCCLHLDLICGGEHATVRVCATTCDWLGSTGVGSSTVDLGFGIRAASPNPSRGSVLVRFAIPEDGAIRLEIFSASGQRVRTLSDGLFNAGPHFVMWDGRGDAGQKLPPGTYFARLRMNQQTDSHKVTLVQ